MRWAAVIGGAIGLFVIAALILVILAPIPGPSSSPAPQSPDTAAPTWAPAGPPPVGAEEPHNGIQTKVDPDWAEQTAAATGIPLRAVLAYAGAAIYKAGQMPECGISWTTLAGVGRIESDHGQYGGSQLDEKGTAKPGIFGIALDGVTTANVPDSDDGEIDGDPDADRAVGPMQLIPQTWRNWHVDGGADGREDPQNIYDATLAAANYLCRSSGAMDTEDGWRAAISAYNSSETYLSNVAAAAASYNEAVGG
jgi:membrane-bound lytic murein transglycosylase B